MAASARARWPTRLLALVVLAPWVGLLTSSLLPDSGGSTHALVWLSVVTCVAALVVLGGAAPRSAPERSAWLLLGAGLAGYGTGFVIVSFITSGEGAGPWHLNLSDTVSLLLYPCAYAGLVLLTRDRTGVRPSRSSLLDGAVVLTGGGAVAVSASARLYPSLMHGSFYEVMYSLAYPVGGLTLLVATITGLALSGWRLDRPWALLLLGFTLMTIGDAIYGLRSAGGTFSFGTWLDALYTAGPVCVALASLAPRAGRPGTAGDARVAMAVPAVLTLTAVAVLVVGSMVAVPALAIVLAATCVVLAVGRTMAFLHQDAALARTRTQASTDELTGLANRRALLAELHRAARASVPRGGPGAVLLLIDLDGFKEVNDSLGHAAGDELLVLVSDRLRAGAPGCLVARLGGDEFAVVLPEGGEHTHAGGAALASRLRELLGRPALLAATRVAVGASIGCAEVPREPVDEHTDLATEAVRRADTALYRAKELRTGCEQWVAALDGPVRRRLELVTELREALSAGDQLVAYYQPMVDPGSGRVVGLEALVRWQHPTRGLLLPGAFLDQLERAGLLPALTHAVLDQALAVVRDLLRLGYDLHVAVNVGAPDLLDLDLPAVVAGLLDRHGVPARSLQLEVSENVVMQEPERTIATLHGLRVLGVGLALDDYGTGMASLGYLRHLPVDDLKIDRSLVEELATDPACAVIVSSTIQLAHDLGLRAVAEGVEDQTTLEALAAAGCDVVQGWHTGRPVAPEALDEALRTLSVAAWRARQIEAQDVRALSGSALRT